jgi:hypothetical protein
MIIAGLFIVYLLLNLGVAVMYQEKIDSIATAAADHISNGVYWMGMEIPEDLVKHRPTNVLEAKDLVDQMLQHLGLPKHDDTTWVDSTSDPVQLNNDTGEARITKVSFKVSGLNSVSGSFSPFGLPFLLPAFSLQANGMSAASASPAYGTCTLHFRDVNETGGAMRNIRIPIYFCGIAHNPTGYVLEKGPFLGNPLHAYIAVDACCYRDDPQHPRIVADETGGSPTYGNTSYGFPLPWWGYGINLGFLPSSLRPPPPSLGTPMPAAGDVSSDGSN